MPGVIKLSPNLMLEIGPRWRLHKTLCAFLAYSLLIRQIIDRADVDGVDATTEPIAKIHRRLIAATQYVDQYEIAGCASGRNSLTRTKLPG